MSSDLQPGIEEKQNTFIVDASSCMVLTSFDLDERGLRSPDKTVVCNFKSQKHLDAYLFLLSKATRAKDGTMQVHAPASLFLKYGFDHSLIEFFCSYGLLELVDKVSSSPGPGRPAHIYRVRELEAKMVSSAETAAKTKGKMRKVEREDEWEQDYIRPTSVKPAILSRQELIQQIEQKEIAIKKAKEDFTREMERQEADLESLRYLFANYDFIIEALTGEN